MRRSLVITLALAVTLIGGAASASAQQLNPGDFVVNLQPPGAPPTGLPDCTPSLTSLGPTTTFPVTAECTDNTVTKAQTQTGTASNPTLAASTGDTGFNSGTVNAVCDATQNLKMTLEITQTGSTLKRFSGTLFQSCTFQMVFADAAKSSLSGTIEANGVLGSEDGTVVNNVVNVSFTARVYVTQGTGAFAGYVGSGTFSQTETIDLSTSSGGGGGTTNPLQAFCTQNGITDCTEAGVTTWCSIPANAPACASLPRPRSTRQAVGDTMKLTLVKKAGSARILAPSAPVGKPRAAAKVRATTRVKVAATKGAVCAVRTNRGVLVGKATAKGTYGTAIIRPKRGAYRGAKTIKATCTKGGKSFASQAVKIKL